jgi:hypothetical protein
MWALAKGGFMSDSLNGPNVRDDATEANRSLRLAAFVVVASILVVTYLRLAPVREIHGPQAFSDARVALEQSVRKIKEQRIPPSRIGTLELYDLGWGSSDFRAIDAVPQGTSPKRHLRNFAWVRRDSAGRFTIEICTTDGPLGYLFSDFDLPPVAPGEWKSFESLGPFHLRGALVAPHWWMIISRS